MEIKIRELTKELKMYVDTRQLLEKQQGQQQVYKRFQIDDI